MRMPMLTRRNFVAGGAAALALGSDLLHPARLMASPLGLPLGLQLYSVREQLAKDYAGTLQQIGALGYVEVEAAGFYDRTPAQVKQAMDAAGLRCVSAHYPWMALADGKDEAVIAFCQELGVSYIICAFPGIKDPSRLQDKSYKGMVTAFTLEDWRWNADNFNKIGAKVKAAGLKFGYHNHTMEFKPQDGVVPLDEVIRLTDPKLVTFELDCGWVHVGGGDPVAYLNKYPDRISMLHVKDFKKTDKPATVLEPPPAAELGRGTSDYRPIFEAAKKGHITHYFVEQEAFDMPPMQALKIDAEYMKKLTV